MCVSWAHPSFNFVSRWRKNVKSGKTSRFVPANIRSVSIETAIAVGCVLWISWAVVCAFLSMGPRDDAASGLVWRALRLYAFVWHRTTVISPEGLDRDRQTGPLIVVANHTAGVDPLLIQAACRFEIRWLMAEDMRSPFLESFWQWARIIFITRGAGDSSRIRETLRHLAGGGVIGIFPEGGLERPPGQVMRFQHGVGMLVKKSRAPVLPIAITGTPQVDPAWSSLWHRGRAVVRFLPVKDYADQGLSVSEIAEDLQRSIAEAVGWPMNTERASEDMLGASTKGASYPGVRVPAI